MYKHSSLKNDTYFSKLLNYHLSIGPKMSNFKGHIDLHACISVCLITEEDNWPFCRRYVLQISSGIDEPGAVRWQLALCLALVWVMCYFCIWKGIKWMGKLRGRAGVSHTETVGPLLYLRTLTIYTYVQSRTSKNKVHSVFVLNVFVN